MIAYREADDRDVPFVVDAWAKSFRHSDTSGLIQVEDWFAVMIPQFEKIIRRPDVCTTIAYETDDSERVADIYGFMVADIERRVPLVYYVFIKQPYRCLGVARKLMECNGLDEKKPFHYACSTQMSHKLRHKMPMAKWSPKLGRFPKSERGQ